MHFLAKEKEMVLLSAHYGKNLKLGRGGRLRTHSIRHAGIFNFTKFLHPRTEVSIDKMDSLLQNRIQLLKTSLLRINLIFLTLLKKETNSPFLILAKEFLVLTCFNFMPSNPYPFCFTRQLKISGRFQRTEISWQQNKNTSDLPVGGRLKFFQPN